MFVSLLSFLEVRSWGWSSRDAEECGVRVALGGQRLARNRCKTENSDFELARSNFLFYGKLVVNTGFTALVNLTDLKFRKVIYLSVQLNIIYT